MAEAEQNPNDQTEKKETTNHDAIFKELLMQYSKNY
jgi:hypothetical protein